MISMLGSLFSFPFFLRRFSKQRKYILVSLFIFGILHSVSALQIPLVFSWDSLNSGSYTETQTNKEISWNEFYRVGIAVDSVVYKQTELKFHAQNRAEFLKNYLELKDVQLTYRLDNWAIKASSQPIGYGIRDGRNPYHLLSPAKGDYLFQASRFNGLRIAYWRGESTFGIALGGNVQNQAIAAIDALWEKSDHSLQFSLSQEARAMDTFWRTPVGISAASADFNTQKLTLHSEFAFSYFPKHDLTKEHISTFSQLELGIKPSPQSFFYVIAESNQLEPKQNALQFFQTTFSYDIASFSLTPGVTIDSFENQSTSSYHFLAEWHLGKFQRVGMFYRLEESSHIKSRHIVGLQAELYYGI
ncbi:MAG: hypothetical protein PHY48_08700 [Candidatus Cloacimonetes bacterium]|nr:hypothetical protein [Candidatus Cloacimonadota bacterium]